MTSPLTASRQRVLLGRAGHQHACGHGCFCFQQGRLDCQTCWRTSVRERMAREYYEDGLSTEALLERRS